jgi:hypothetical protein
MPVDKRPCDAVLIDTANDLSVMVDEGPGDGSFDYVPEGWPQIGSISGDYNLKTGAFSWEVKPAEAEAWRLLEDVGGIGLIERNGSIDTDYTKVTTYKNGDLLQQQIRHQRAGCLDTRHIENLDTGEITLITGTWSNSGMAWVRDFTQGPAAAQAEGHLNHDHSWWETVDHKNNDIALSWQTEADGTGYAIHTFDDDDGWNNTKGTSEVFLDGTIAMDFTLNHPETDKQTWVFSVDGSGDGTGTWVRGGDTCTVKYKSGDCQLKSCTDPDLDGDCAPPVVWPQR